MKRLYIETVGCQMNMLDSELVVASLRQQGYELTADPAQADTILLNTCSVREHAEEKIYSRLGVLKQLKQQNPGKIVGVLGCMAQNHQKTVFQRAPYVDLVVGPGQLHRVPELIEKAAAGEGRQLEVSLGRKDGNKLEIARSHESFDPLRDPDMRPSAYQAYVRIQIGCDKFCTYCIVPSVRGPEQCRPPEEIVAEARHLADHGCLEVTLLGQTVNSYKYRDGGKTYRMSDLLAMLNDIPALKRLKFVTSYPKDMTNDLLDAVRDLPKAVPYLHVPAQSGSNAVLSRMRRGYTVEDYREMMSRIRERVPNCAVSSDFIVGFCGETEEDFQQTLQLTEECRFKNSFIFQYSVRPGTKGAELYADDIPQGVKARRNHELLELQNRISHEDNQNFLGRDVEVLVEDLSKLAKKQIEERRAGHGQHESHGQNAEGEVLQHGEGHEHHHHANGNGHDHAHGEISSASLKVQLMGRTPCDRIVVFEGNPRLIGQIMPVTVIDANAHTLFGEVVTQHVVPELYTLGVM